jgi:hypothetical protein
VSSRLSYQGVDATGNVGCRGGPQMARHLPSRSARSSAPQDLRTAAHTEPLTNGYRAFLDRRVTVTSPVTWANALYVWQPPQATARLTSNAFVMLGRCVRIDFGCVRTVFSPATPSLAKEPAASSCDRGTQVFRRIGRYRSRCLNKGAENMDDQMICPMCMGYVHAVHSCAGGARPGLSMAALIGLPCWS